MTEGHNLGWIPLLLGLSRKFSLSPTSTHWYYILLTSQYLDVPPSYRGLEVHACPWARQSRGQATSSAEEARRLGIAVPFWGFSYCILGTDTAICYADSDLVSYDQAGAGLKHVSYLRRSYHFCSTWLSHPLPVIYASCFSWKYPRKFLFLMYIEKNRSHPLPYP